MSISQVTRHYIAYHGGSGDTINNTRYNALYNASNRSLADSYIPTYAAFQNPSRGFADGIMCAMTELNGVPSCVNHFLLTDLLRTEWQSDAIIQTDCCDSLQTVSSFGYKNLTKSEALALSVREGLGIYFGYWVGNFREWMMENLGNGTILPQVWVASLYHAHDTHMLCIPTHRMLASTCTHSQSPPPQPLF